MDFGMDSTDYDIIYLDTKDDHRKRGVDLIFDKINLDNEDDEFDYD